MGFKEQFQEDLDVVFFNLEELAELHTINGRETPIVIDNDALEELYLGRDTHTEQIFTDSIMFCVRKKDMDFEPVIGQYLEYDSERYLVTDVKIDIGTYTVILGGNRH